MRAEDQHCAVWHFSDRLHENRATAAELIYHVTVVDDLVMHVNGRTVCLERELNDIHRAYHPGAKATWTHAEKRFATVGVSAVAAPNLNQRITHLVYSPLNHLIIPYPPVRHAPFRIGP